jgi:hypothetical protein
VPWKSLWRSRSFVHRPLDQLSRSELCLGNKQIGFFLFLNMEGEILVDVDLDGPREVLAACVHPTRSEVWLATMGFGGLHTLVEADAVSGSVMSRLELKRRVRLLARFDTPTALGGDGGFLAIAYEKGDIEVWECTNLELKVRHSPNKKDDGKTVECWSVMMHAGMPSAFLSRGGSVMERVSLLSNEKPLRVDGKCKPLTCIVKHTQAGYLAAGTWDGEVRIIDAKTLLARQVFAPHDAKCRSPVSAMAFSARQPGLMAVSHYHGAIALWNVFSSNSTAESVRVLPNPVVDACFHPWLPVLLTQTDNGEVRSWTLATSATKGHSLAESQLVAPMHMSAMERSYYAHRSVPVKGALMREARKLIFSPRFNFFISIFRRGREILLANPSAGSNMLVYRLCDHLHPYSMMPIFSTNNCAQEEGVRRDLVTILDGAKMVEFNVQEQKESSNSWAVPNLESGECRALHIVSSSKNRLALVFTVTMPGPKYHAHPVTVSVIPGSRGTAAAGAGVIPARDGCFLPQDRMALLSGDGKSVLICNTPKQNQDISAWAREVATHDTDTCVKILSLQAPAVGAWSRMYASPSDLGGIGGVVFYSNESREVCGSAAQTLDDAHESFAPDR